jgi:cysteine protease ATG4
MYHILGIPFNGNYQDHHHPLIYCCYRHGFPEIDGFTDDVGWGCTIRSFQMLLGNSILKCSSHDVKKYIADDGVAPFSFQSLVKQGKTICNHDPGNWFKPSETAKCIRKIFSENENLCKVLGFDFAIYGVDDLDVHFPTLVVFPVKLGIDSIDLSYYHAFFDMLRHPDSMGIISGSGGSSYYLIGASQHEILYLDPHDLRSWNDLSYIHRKINSTRISTLNPSVALAFLVNSKEALVHIEQQYAKIFSTALSTGKDDGKYTCIDDDDEDFCIVVLK